MMMEYFLSNVADLQHETFSLKRASAMQDIFQNSFFLFRKHALVRKERRLRLKTTVTLLWESK